jgi:hypothetical protein
VPALFLTIKYQGVALTRTLVIPLNFGIFGKIRDRFHDSLANPEAVRFLLQILLQPQRPFAFQPLVTCTPAG